jgi:chromate transporter
VVGLIGMAWFSVVKIALLTWDRFAESRLWADLFDWKALLLCLVMLFAIQRFDKHPLLYIAASAIIGIILKL